MSVVTLNLDLPAGQAPAGAKVQVWLAGTAGQPVVGYVGGKQIVGEYNVNLDTNGAGQLDLVGNDLIEPAGTVWGVRIKLPHGPNPDVFYIDVPSTGGPFDVEAVLADPPGALPSTALAVEVARAEAAEVALGARVDTEVLARQDEDTILAAAITAETSRASAAEGTNTNAITAEATARANADTALSTAIAAEATRATAAEATKQPIGTYLVPGDIGSTVQAHDADLDAIALLNTTPFGRALLEASNAAALRTAAALGTAALVDTGTGAANVPTTAQADARYQSAGAVAFTPTAVKTAAYAAAAGDFVPVDTTSGAVTVTLPTAPADKTIVAVKHVIRGGTNVVTVACGGSDVFNKAGGSTSLAVTLLNQALLVQYKASTGIWYVVADDLSLAQLDTRYLPTRLDTRIYYVSKGTAASDSNDGLTWATAFATIAGALTAIGGTSTNTNPAIIVLGYGTFGSSGSPLPTHVIKGVTGFVIQGQGAELTSLWGPDAAPLFQCINTRIFRLKDCTYLGSPSATGWGLEFDANYGGSAWVGGIVATQCGAERVHFGDITKSAAATAAAAYGIRWMLYNGDFLNDANNDQGVVKDCIFNGVLTPLSAEHSNSLIHQVERCQFLNCGGMFKFQGGSATIVDCSAGGSGQTGYLIDLQDPAGTSSFPAQTQALYRRATTVIGFQSEGNSMGWARSTVGAGVAVGGTDTVAQVTFIGGELDGGGVGGAGTKCVDWQAPSSALRFIGTRCSGRFSAAIVYASSATSIVSFVGCEIHVGDFQCSGELTFINCHSVGAFTKTVTPAVYNESSSTGSGFLGGTWVSGTQSTILKAVKTANASKTSDTVKAVDSELTVPVVAGHTYIGEVIVFYDGSTTGDISFALATPTGATLIQGEHALVSTVTTAVGSINATATTTAALSSGGAAGAGTKLMAIIKFTVITDATHAGSIALQWAQAISDTTATTVYAGSSIRAEVAA